MNFRLMKETVARAGVR